MNIYEKLLNITSEIKNVSKNLEVGVGKNSYKAVGEADVLFAVKQLEQKYKVYSYPCKREVIDRAILETEKEYNGNVTKGNQIFLRIETTYRFVNIENPEEYIEITTYGDGIDTQDKAVGKAMTYADKYALLKAYKIITGDDPDQEHSPDTAKYTKATTTGDDRKATPKQIEVLAKTYTGENLAKLLKANGVERIEDISMSKASELIGRLKKKEN
jgi:hypothetical protein